MAVRTKALDRMWNDWRDTFPASNRAEDGWIGDAAHQAETSGHNPDDTPGSRAEYSDADTIAEVRAIDKDARLNSTITMQQVVDRMLATPGDLVRLRYIIFNGYIWRKAGGWKRETYTGKDKHRTHAHFSGDPNFDEASAEWTSITHFKLGNLEGDDMAIDDAGNFTKPLTQGTPGYAGQQRDTALAFIWKGVADANALLTEARAADFSQNTTLTTILNLLQQATAAGGGPLDTAAITAAIAAEHEATRALLADQHTAEMAELQRQHQEELAGLRARLAASNA